MAEDPGLKATPSGSIDPGHGHVLQDENEEEAQRCPVFIQQVHIVAARGPCRNKAAQEHTHIQTPTGGKQQIWVKVRIQAQLGKSFSGVKVNNGHRWEGSQRSEYL